MIYWYNTCLGARNEQSPYRLYVQVFKKRDQSENIGYVIHCDECGDRRLSPKLQHVCKLCGSETKIGGPLWIDTIFDQEFVKSMISNVAKLHVDTRCKKIVSIAALESTLPATYYTLDEIASKTGVSSPKLTRLISVLNHECFEASPTVFDPTGFRTTANVKQMSSIFVTESLKI